MIDFAIPYGTRVDHKEVEKIEKYLNLARELKKMWNTKAPVVLFVVAALGTPAKALEKRLKTIGIETKLTELQKNCLDTNLQNPPKSSWGESSLADTMP